MIKLSKITIFVMAISIALAMPTGKANAEGSSVELDILFLNADSANYDYAVSGYGAAGSSILSGDIERVEPGFDAGFRLSYDSGNNFKVSLTTLSVSDSDSAAGSGNLAATQLHPDIFYTGGFDPLNIDSASADMSLDLTVIDLEMDTDITLSGNTGGTLFAGLRIMDLSNELDVTYVGAVLSTTATSSRALDFSGFGVRAGFDVRWNLGKINLVTGAAFSLLTGEIDASAQESVSDTGLLYKVDSSDSAVLKITEMNMGAEFQTGNISYGLGYEFTNIEGLYSSRFTDDVSHGTLSNSSENLSLSGFYLRAGMAF